MARRRRAVRTSEQASDPLRLVAVCGGIGYLPGAPGSAASLLTAGLCLVLLRLPWPLYLALAAAVAGLAVAAASRTAAAMGERDPGVIVIDEVAGMLVAAIGLAPTPYEVGAAFLLFRLFDVVKPSPIPRLEALPHGLGVVADDLAAGLFAAFTWWLLKVNFDFL